MKTVNPPKTVVTQVQVAINVEETGKQLKNITKEKGYEVKDLMTLTGYSSQAVYKWFNGKSLPSIDTLVVLSQALNTEISGLLVIDGEFHFRGIIKENKCIYTTRFTGRCIRMFFCVQTDKNNCLRTQVLL